MSSRPIADYALISDCHSAALVASDGSIEWLCFSRFDGPSVFARTLDDDAGHWSIGIEGATTTRRYIDDSMVVETTFQTSSGEATLVDALAVGQNERGHSLGLNSPHALLRRITCTSGEVEFKFEYAPRPEYGLIMPILTKVDGGIAARGGADVLLLSSPIDMGRSESTARAGIRLSQGQSVCFGLQHWRSWEEPIGPWREDQVAARIDDTVSAWNSWSGHHQAYDGPWRDLVHQSGRVLQSLTFAPTGAIVASPTTSLPEEAGGERNWDYRYAWVRDASLTVEALWVAACPDEADRFFDWMAGAAATQLHRGADLQIMFGVGGERDLTERSLDHLRGWRDSKPVRVGNGAWDQRQLDVYGELLNGAYRLSDQLKDFDPTTRSFLAAAADTAAARWEEPDQGIWEIRGGPQHFLYSKLMCWVALDRAIYLADRIDGSGRVEHWSKTRDEIKDAILQRGWSESARSFAQSLGSDDLDASVLMMPIMGFISATDPRMIETLRAVEDRLTDERGLVYRYKAHDGLEGEEGTFLLCTFWLAQSQALAGEVSRARQTFERAIEYVNDLGLLAEEVDPDTRELLGNFPQAFSHIGLVNAAWAISQAEKGLNPGGSPLGSV